MERSFCIPVELLPYLFYPVLMGIGALLFIIFFGNKKEKAAEPKS